MYGYFHDDKRIFIMLEFALHGELYKQLSKVGRFDEKRASRVCLSPHSTPSEAPRWVWLPGMNSAGLQIHALYAVEVERSSPRQAQDLPLTAPSI